MKTLVIEMDDRVYNELLASGKRLRGSLGVVTREVGDFRPHAEQGRKAGTPCATQKLPHGRVSITAEKLRLTLNVDRTERTPVSEMVIDTLQAKEFANEVIYGVSAWPYGV